MSLPSGEDNIMGDPQMVITLTEKTHAVLKDLWKQIGTSDEEAAQQLQKLCDAVTGVYTNEVQEWSIKKKDMEKAIIDNTVEIDRLAKRLCCVDETISELEALDDDQPLKRRLFEVEEILSRLKKMNDLRLKCLQGYQAGILELHKEMGTTAAPEFSEIGETLEKEKLRTFEAEMNRLQEIKQQRVDEVAFMVADVANLWKELDIPKEERMSELDLRISSNEHGKVGIDSDSMEAVRARKTELEAEKIRRMAEIDALSRKIGPLWDRLDVSLQERKEFSSKVNGITLPIVQCYHEELKRVEELKLAKCGQLIEEGRERISELWQQLRVSDSVKAEFTWFTCKTFDEESLTAHEEKVKELEEQLERYAPVMEQVAAREALQKQIAEFRESSQDGSRLTGRGAFKILNHEENMRRAIATTLPKLEARLLKQIEKWEEKHGLAFVLDGGRYFETIKREQAQEAELNRIKKSATDSKINTGTPSRPRTGSVSSSSTATTPSARPGSAKPKAKAARANTARPLSRSRSVTKDVAVTPLGNRFGFGAKSKSKIDIASSSVLPSSSSESNRLPVQEMGDLTLDDLDSESRASESQRAEEEEDAEAVDDATESMMSSSRKSSIVSLAASSVDTENLNSSNKAPQEDEDEFDAATTRAEAAMATKDFAAAVASYTAAIKLTSNSDDLIHLYSQRSKAYGEMHDFALALKDSDTALRINNNQRDTASE